MSASKLLVVDDHQENLAVLVEILSPNYTVRVANNGKRGLQLAKDDPPDLILLDIMMPNMSGFEVCEALKASDELAEIPVIFISAADDVDSKVAAFQSGGVDYVSKPFQVQELEARIATHLSHRELQKQLEFHNRALDLQVQLKSQELAKAYERLTIVNSTKNEFLELIAHELRTPANGLIGLSEMILDNDVSASEIEELRPLFGQSRDRMIETLDNALLLARIHVSKENFQAQQVSLNAIFDSTRVAVDKYSQKHSVSITFPTIEKLSVAGEDKLLTTAIDSLLKTAIKFAKTGTTVTVRCLEDDEKVSIYTKSEGDELEPKVIANFFDVFSSVRSYTYAEELGLSPVVAERIVSLYGGSLTVENQQENKGVKLQMTLLKAQ